MVVFTVSMLSSICSLSDAEIVTGKYKYLIGLLTFRPSKHSECVYKAHTHRQEEKERNSCTSIQIVLITAMLIRAIEIEMFYIRIQCAAWSQN